MGLPYYLPDYDDDAPTRAGELFPAHVGVATALRTTPPSAPPLASEPPPASSASPANSASDASVKTSVLRLRVPIDPEDHETRETMRALADQQVGLAAGIAWAQGRLKEIPRDPASRAAGLTVSARLADLGDVRDALSEIYASLARQLNAVRDPAASGSYLSPSTLFSAQSALTDYLDATYRWVFSVLGALSELADELCGLEADWSTFRERLATAESIPSCFAPTVRNALWAMADEEARLDMTSAFEELTFAGHMLGENLTHRFG